MKLEFKLLFGIFILLLNTSCGERSSDLLIRNITIVSPEKIQNDFKSDVYIKNGVIEQIANNLEIEANQTIDGTDSFLTPGLIDSHVHLGSVPGMTYGQERANKKLVKSAKRQIPKSYLYHGFTTIIDLHSNSDRTRQWNNQKIRPTAYFYGGAPLIDGYPMSFIPEAFRYTLTQYFIMEENTTRKKINAERHTPAAVVSRMKSDGAICVKTHFEPGFGGENKLPTPSVELITELKAQATKHDLKLLLHANSEQAHRFGLTAGVDAIVHGMWKWKDISQKSPNAEITSLIDEQLAKRISLQPTIQVLYGERDLHGPEYLSQNALKDVLPQELIDWYATTEGQQFRNQMSENAYVKKRLEDKQWQTINAEPISRVISTLNYWVNNNGSLIFGSDSPSSPTFANPPGLNGRLEMDRWKQAGVTPIQFFIAATIDNARFFKLDDKIGTIEQGKRADMLIMANDPRQSIEAFDTIDWVISEGVAIKRLDLSANSSANTR